jgi:DNA-binding response OmpR family regulator
VAQMVKLALEKQGVDCYTLKTSIDCFYLIRDLSPQLLVFDATLFLMEEERFFSELEHYPELKKIPIIVTATVQEWQELKSKKRVTSMIEKPIAPFAIKDKLEAILNLH